MGSVYVCIDIHDRRVHLHRHVCAHDTIPHVVACICDPSYHRLCTMQSRYSSCTFASIHVKQTCKSIKETYKVANESKNRSSSKHKESRNKTNLQVGPLQESPVLRVADMQHNLCDAGPQICIYQPHYESGKFGNKHFEIGIIRENCNYLRKHLAPEIELVTREVCGGVGLSPATARPSVEIHLQRQR